MRALVISGGGSKGAFAGGIAEYLIRERGLKYGLFVGTSTGSLLIPLLSIGEINKIKTIYTSVTQKDVFNNCPFKFKKEGDVYKTSINHFGIIKMFIKGAKTFGDSSNLHQLIREILTEKDFYRIRSNFVDVVVTVSNFSTNKVEYKLAKDCTYKDFVDWMWASSNFIPFMSLLEKNDQEYGDGGFGDLVPISEAISRGATEIDIIVLKREKPRINKKKVRNALELTTRVFDFMLDQIANDDITIGRFNGAEKKVILNFYHPPELLTENSLIFEPKMMSKWWQEGLEFGKRTNPISKLIEIGVDTD
ncbi:MAG: patatin-like phospholipase family protein [Anditalea sp.]